MRMPALVRTPSNAMVDGYAGRAWPDRTPSRVSCRARTDSDSRTAFRPDRPSASARSTRAGSASATHRPGGAAGWLGTCASGSTPGDHPARRRAAGQRLAALSGAGQPTGELARLGVDPAPLLVAGRLGDDRAARRTPEVEAAHVRADIDAGRPSRSDWCAITGLNPWGMTKSHQVARLRLRGRGEAMTLRIYDPNWPSRDDVTISIWPSRTPPVDRRDAAGACQHRLTTESSGCTTRSRNELDERRVELPPGLAPELLERLVDVAAARYGRSWTIASKASTRPTIRAPSGIASPRSRSG